MNEHLKELMIQAGYAAPELAERAQILAELLVRECGRIAFEQWCENRENESAQWTIVRHFGVE